MTNAVENDKAGLNGQSTARPSSGLAQFAIKTCVVAVAISVCSIFVIDWVIGDLEDFAAQTIASVRYQAANTTIGGRKFWTKVESGLDRAAAPASDLPPEEKKKLINDVRIIVARWRPFLDAVQDELQKPRGSD
jgi:hypothetical protein